MKSNRYIIFLIFVTLWACNREEQIGERKEEQSTWILVNKDQWDANNFELAGIREEFFSRSIRTNGTIDVPPNSKASIHVMMPGYIKDIKYIEGDTIRKGDVLFQLENPDFINLQKEFLELSYKRDYLEREYERQKNMLDEQVTAQKKVLKTESEYNAVNAQYLGLKEKLRLLHIPIENISANRISSVINVYAPINGRIAKINFSKGSYVSETTEVMQIINEEHIHVELYVYEKDVSHIKTGADILFKVPETSSKMYRAKVHQVGSIIDGERRIKIHGHIVDSIDIKLISGMFVEGEIMYDREVKKGLPMTSIVEEGNTYYALRLVKQDTTGFYFDQVKVNVGDRTEEFVEIANQELLKDKFLKKGAFMLIKE